jgi:outer membrane protein TolC
MSRHARRIALFSGASLLVLAGCAVKPHPLTDAERSAQAVADTQAMFAGQEPLDHPLTLQEAYARALKYNLDRRVKLMEEAVAYDGLDVANFDMLPKLTADAGYLSRSNTLAESSEAVATGQQSLVTSTSEDKNRVVADLTLSWNILDFGVSYYAARQQADRALIQEERKRKVVQNLLQDVRGAFWRAASAQALNDKIEKAIRDAEGALDRSRRGEAVRAPLEALRYQRFLLDLLRQLEDVRQKLQIAKTDLAALINLPPGQVYTIAVPGDAAMAYTPITRDIGELERVALIRNPDLRELSYETRISVDETHKALLKLLPSINLNYGGFFDSNSFLLHNWWGEGAARVSWNLLNLITGPASIHLADDQVKLTELRRQAVSMAVLAKLHIAYEQYVYVGKEYQRTRELSGVDQRIVSQVEAGVAARKSTEAERVTDQVYAVGSELRQYETFAEVQAALARIYATVGLDPDPADPGSLDVSALSRQLDQIMASWQQPTPLPPPGPPAPPPRTGLDGFLDSLFGN